MQKKIRKKEQGFGIIEILIAISLAAVILTSFLGLTWQTVKINRANIKELQARMYLKELIEITRDLEQSDWDEIISCSSSCFAVASSSNWKIENGLENIENNNNKFTRWFEINPGDNENIKKVTTYIKWNDGFKDRNLKLETYIYNYDF